MNPSDRKYLLENRSKKSPAELARDLGLKERAVKRFLEREERPAATQAAGRTSLPAPAAVFEPRLFLVFPALFALAFLVYSNTLGSSFHYDDEFMIVQNAAIRGLDPGRIWDAFNTRFVAGLTFAANYAAGGLEPSGYHWTNVFFHALAAIAVFLLVRMTFETPRMRERPLAPGAALAPIFASALFLVHPVQTQAVDYVWQRAAVLAALFSLLALLFYARWRLYRRKTDAVLALASTALGMFSKETAFTIPFAIALYEFLFFTPERFSSRARRLAPFLVLLAVIPLMLTRVDKISTNLMRPDALRQPAAAGAPAPSFDMTRWVSGETMSRREYWLTQPNVVRTYLRLFFFPAGQNLDYDYPVTRSPDGPTLLSFALEAALFAAAVLLRKRFPAVAFGILWAFLAMSVESLVIQNDVIYEHRLYLPMAGWSIAFAAGAASLVRRRKAYLVLLALLACVLAGVTWQRNKAWKSELTLWQDVVRKSPKKARGYYNLGVEYGKQDRAADAEACFLKACTFDREYARRRGGRFDPDAAEDFLMLGNIYAKRGQAREAAGYYEQALAIKLSLGLNPYKIYTNLANARGAMGDVDKACEAYRLAMQAAPGEARIFANAGTYYAGIGKTEEGIRYLEEAVRLDPESGAAKDALAAARRGARL